MKVKLISYSKPVIEGLNTPTDLVAYCARVSNPSNQHNSETSEKLIQYLIKHKHWSPLELCNVVLEIETTRDIARQILRHRSFSFQEFSQRYADPIKDLEFVMREARLQDPKNRQNSISEGRDLEISDESEAAIQQKLRVTDFRHVIEAFDLVKLSQPDLRLVLAGSPGYGYQDIEKAMNKSEYKKDIINLSRVNNLEKFTLYQHTRAVLYPSFYEGFGFPILEALQQGVPVIASDIPSSREVGNSMIEYIEVDNIKAWAKAMIAALQKDKLKSDIQARQEYTQKFDFKDTIEQTKNIILK